MIQYSKEPLLSNQWGWFVDLDTSSSSRFTPQFKNSRYNNKSSKYIYKMPIIEENEMDSARVKRTSSYIFTNNDLYYDDNGSQYYAPEQITICDKICFVSILSVLFLGFVAIVVLV